MQSLPRCLLDETEAFSHFLSSYPSYRNTLVIDSLRQLEYPHLDEKGQVCLDYSGVGLFSGAQQRQEFGLSHISVNLATHAMYPDDGSVESALRKRVLQYMNLDEEDYYLVFTANAYTAFKLLGESYPFHQAQNLLLAYDHPGDDIAAISDCCLAKSGSVQSASLSFPLLMVDADDVEKKLQLKRRPTSQKPGIKRGLFAYPFSSRVTGCRNSSRWIQEAQRNGWHVLLDVTSMDAKMLDSLGLSHFLPEFIICSFYNVFGEDPTGMGCLAIKKSVLRILGDSSRARAIGMVKVVAKGESVSGARDGDHLPDTNGSIMEDQMHRRHDSNPLDGLSFQPEWSADMFPIDNSVFYGSDSDSTKSSKEFSRAERDDMLYRKGNLGAGPSNVEIDDRSMSVFSNLKSQAESIDPNENHASSNGVGGNGYWMPWDMLQVYGTTETIYQPEMATASRSWYRQNMEIEGAGPSELHPPQKFSSDERVHQAKVLTRKSVKGLFYGDYQNTEKFSLVPRFKWRSNSKTEKKKLAAVLESSADNWKVFYARKRKFLFSSSSGMSSVSAPSSPLPSGAKIGNEVCCKGLDQADMLGYKRIAVRLRALSRWLISALLMLRHPEPESTKLVKVYGPLSPTELGSTIAFTLLDPIGNPLDSERVQLLADRNNVSLRSGTIEGTLSFGSNSKPHDDFLNCVELTGYKWRSKGDSSQTINVPVIYASLGFLNNFSDVHKLWTFITKFLDPEFLNNELWHYQALNQETIAI